MKNWIIDAIKTEEDSNVSPNYEKLFNQIAERLMNNYCLEVEDKKFRLSEIEFYYFHKNYHPDCNVHRHKFQREFSIYFHDKHGRGGIDIGFGDHECWGGILIRGIQDYNSKNFISGPLNVADEITKIKKQNYENLTNKNLLDAKIVVIKAQEQERKKIFIGPRVGLVNENDFLIKNYRFVTDFIVNHKFPEKSLVYLASPEVKDIKGFKINTILESLKSKANRSSKIYTQYKGKTDE